MRRRNVESSPFYIADGMEIAVMAETTNIGWCDATFNPWIGCTEVSDACGPCYAREWAARYYPAAKWGDFPRIRTSEGVWKMPRRLNATAEKEGTRPFLFCASLSDIGDNQAPMEWFIDTMNLARETPNVVWLLLTKRIAMLAKRAKEAGGLPSNCAIGSTFANQEEYDRDRIKLRTARDELGALFSFCSIEPQLGYIIPDKNAPDWLIVGGMSGPQWREHDLPADWVRPLRDFAVSTKRSFYLKQWSALRPKGRGCELDGREWKERPYFPPLKMTPRDLFGEAA